MLSIIVATTPRGVIGKDNRLLWRIPTDLRFFKEKTMGHAMIMGRKTFESLGGPLPGRTHLVLTRDPDYAAPQGVTLLHGLEAIRPYRQGEEEVFVIGGGAIYRALMDQVEKLYITWVETDVEGDTFFPLEALKDFTEVHREETVDAASGTALAFTTYVRRKG